MPDERGDKLAEKDPTDSSLHAYKEGRQDQVEDDPALHGDPPENAPSRGGAGPTQTLDGGPPGGAGGDAHATGQEPDGDSVAEQGLGSATGGIDGGRPNR